MLFRFRIPDQGARVVLWVAADVVCPRSRVMRYRSTCTFNRLKSLGCDDRRLET